MCVTGYRYITHLYCLAVQAGFYSDVVECWPATQMARGRSPAAVLVIRIFSPACTARQYNGVIYLYPVTCVWFVHEHIIRKLHTKLPCYICVQLYANVTHYHCHVLRMRTTVRICNNILRIRTCDIHILTPSDWRPGGRRFNPRRGRQHSFVEIDHEIFSTVILSLPLIQEGQLSVSGERMCTILVNRLED